MDSIASQDRPERGLRAVSVRLSKPWWSLLGPGSAYVITELHGALRGDREVALKTARRMLWPIGAAEMSILKIPIESRSAIVARFYRSTAPLVEPRAAIERATLFADAALDLCRTYDRAEIIATPSLLQILFPKSPPTQDILAAAEALLTALESVSPIVSHAKRRYGGYRSVKDGPRIEAPKGTLARVEARAEALWSSFPQLPARLSYG